MVSLQFETQGVVPNLLEQTALLTVVTNNVPKLTQCRILNVTTVSWVSCCNEGALPVAHSTCADREDALIQHYVLSVQQAANLSKTNITMAVTLHVNGTYTPQVSSPSNADPTLSKPVVPCMHATMPRPPCYTVRSRLQHVRSAGPADGYSKRNDSRTGQTWRPYDSHSQNSICAGAQSIQTGDNMPPEALALLCCT
jgi:hypothetical protein